MTRRAPPLDLLAAAMLLALGLVVMMSASIELSLRATGDPLHYFRRQLLYAAFGALAMLLLAQVPLAVHRRLAKLYGLVALALLVLVLLPGVGVAVNEGRRWLELGALRFQPSELAKPALLVWLAAYLTQHAAEARESLRGLLAPLGMTALVALLLVLEPDFGTACVVAATALGVIFLCGGPLRALFGCAAAGAVALGGLAVAAPYRLLRIQSFLDPWAEPFGSGYQLTQSLIAIGSGGLLGQGLGGGVQKHFYLPEMHTDFVFAVAAEELGLFGAALIVALFGLFALGALRAARRAQAAEQDFAAALACGVGLWIGLQAFVNIAVNMGALPTKGLTLPFMSAGGSSLVASFAGLGLLWRVHRETAGDAFGAAARRRRRPA